MPSISLCIVSTGADAALVEKTITSCRGAVNEIILVCRDQISPELSKVASEAGAQIFEMEQEESLGAAGNLALEKVTSDWVLAMEPGEALGDGADLRRLADTVAKGAFSGYTLTVLYGADPETGDTEAEGHCADPRGVFAGSAIRLFQAIPEYRYTPEGEIMIPRKSSVGAIDVHIHTPGFIVGSGGDHSEAQGLFEEGSKLVQSGKLEEAEKLLRRAAEMVQTVTPLGGSILKALSLCLVQMERSKEALRILKGATEAYPDFTDLFYVTGLAFYDLEDYMPALRNFEYCLTKGDAPPHYGGWKGVSSYRAEREMAEVFLCMNDIERAEQYFRQALRSNPIDGYAMEGLGEILLSRMDPDSGIAELEKAADFTDIDVLRSAVDLFKRFGDRNRADAYQERVDSFSLN